MVAAAIFAGAWAAVVFLCAQAGSAGLYIPPERPVAFQPVVAGTGCTAAGGERKYADRCGDLRYAGLSANKPGVTNTGIHFSHCVPVPVIQVNSL